jgi:hypothetical protein
MKDLEARKRALVQEAEIYRETLKLELQNIRLSAIQLKKQFSSLRSSNPLMMLAAPLAGLFLRKSSGPPKLKFLSSAIFLWQLYRKISALLPSLFPGAASVRTGSRAEERTPAANL